LCLAPIGARQPADLDSADLSTQVYVQGVAGNIKGLWD